MSVSSVLEALQPPSGHRRNAALNKPGAACEDARAAMLSKSSFDYGDFDLDLQVLGLRARSWRRLRAALGERRQHGCEARARRASGEA